MKLYMVPAAPNPTKVMLYVAERQQMGAQLPIETVLVNLVKSEQRAPEHLARNPFGTLPVLELDDGSYLIESLAMITYLEEKFPQASLLTGSVEARAHARDLERVVETRIALPMMRYVHATNSPLGWPADPKAAAEIEASLPAGLDFLEQLLADGRPLLTGDQVSLADCTLQAACQFGRFGKAEGLAALFAQRPLLNAWDEAYRARPAAKQVLKF